MALLVNLAKVALIVFLVVGTATFVVIYRRRLRRREPLPPWPPAGPVYYGYARKPLPRGSMSTATSSTPTVSMIPLTPVGMPRPGEIRRGRPDRVRAARRRTAD